MKTELQGRIIRISDTQTFDSGFQKREFVIECGDEKYPNPIPIEAVKDKCAVLDKFSAGELVDVAAFLNGNYWEKGDRYFLSLRLSYVKHTEGQSEAPAAVQTRTEPEAVTGVQNEAVGEEEIPF